MCCLLQLHLKQLSLFGMITRLPGSILHKHAVYVLVSLKSSCKSWFYQIRELCLTYNLPHPLQLLEFPSFKLSFSTLVKKKGLSYWEQKLRSQANLPSLVHFKPEFMSLKYPHPLWTTAGSSPYEIVKARV